MKISGNQCRKGKKDTERHLGVAHICYGMLVILITLKSVGWGETQPQRETISEQTSRGPVKASISVVPARIRFDREMIMKLRVIAPSEVEIKLPPLSECVEGFTVANITDENFKTDEGIIVTGKVARLVPYPSSEYWIGPVVIEYLDRSYSPCVTGWLTLKPLSVEYESPPVLQTNMLSGEPELFVPEEKLKRYRIYFLPLIISVVVFMVVFLFLRQNQMKSEEELTPYQYALKELDKIQTHLDNSAYNIKLAYTELTEVIRRYISDSYMINARNLTSLELIQSLATRVGAEALNKLHSFLNLADAVKFAAYCPTREKVLASPAIVKECLELIETGRKYQSDVNSSMPAEGLKHDV